MAVRRHNVNAKSLKNLKPFKKGNPDGRAGNKGSKSKWAIISEEARRQLAARIGITPLEFLMSLLRDDNTPIELKIRAAVECAPYMHRRMPIAIEGGDKPLTVIDPAQLAKLSSKQLAMLMEIMKTIGADKARLVEK